MVDCEIPCKAVKEELGEKLNVKMFMWIFGTSLTVVGGIGAILVGLMFKTQESIRSSLEITQKGVGDIKSTVALHSYQLSTLQEHIKRVEAEVRAINGKD